MIDKFASYYNTEEKVAELSEYVHINMKIIYTKMISEIRKKLDIEPELTNRDGYISLVVSLQGFIFNECVYSLAAICQSVDMKFDQIVPMRTLEILLSLLKGDDPLKGKPRDDVPHDKQKFHQEYMKCIKELRSHKEGHLK